MTRGCSCRHFAAFSPDLASQTSVSPTILPGSESGAIKPDNIAAMDELRLSNSVIRGDQYYREQWSFFYAERRRLLIRLFWLAAGLGVCFLSFATLVDKYPRVAQIFAVPLAILLLALPFQWFHFVWTMRTWNCPRCGEYFFTSTLVNNPFGRRCRHCGIIRPKRSEIGGFHQEYGTTPR